MNLRPLVPNRILAVIETCRFCGFQMTAVEAVAGCLLNAIEFVKVVCFHRYKIVLQSWRDAAKERNTIPDSVLAII